MKEKLATGDRTGCPQDATRFPNILPTNLIARRPPRLGRQVWAGVKQGWTRSTHNETINRTLAVLARSMASPFSLALLSGGAVSLPSIIRVGCVNAHKQKQDSVDSIMRVSCGRHTAVAGHCPG